MSVTTVRLQPDVEVGLEDLAEKLQRSKSWVINQALKEFVERQQRDQGRWQETLDAIESAAQGKLVSGEEVHKWLRSWGTADGFPPPKANE